MTKAGEKLIEAAKEALAMAGNFGVMRNYIGIARQAIDAGPAAEIRVGSLVAFKEKIAEIAPLFPDPKANQPTSFCGVKVIEDRILPEGWAAIYRDGKLVKLIKFSDTNQQEKHDGQI